MKNIFYSPYELEFKTPIGKSAGIIRHGALLQIEGGFADLHPWPELGDLALDEQLKLLKEERLTALTSRSFQIARIDAQARAQSKSLFEGLSIPESHFLASSVFWSDDLHQAQKNKFQRIKFKVNSDLENCAKQLQGLLPQLLPETKIRLDFNSGLNVDSFENFLTLLSDEILDAIDFIEDPFVYEPLRWQQISEKFHCRLALDRQLKPETSEGFDICIVKPAIQVAEPLVNMATAQMKRVVFTSYLDHPLGQMSAAYFAALSLAKDPFAIDICGLLSQEVFKKHAFSEALRIDGPKLMPALGTGFGFDALLNRVAWNRL